MAIETIKHKNGNLDSFLLQFQGGSNLEANAIFPSSPRSAYKSSDFTESFDFPFNPDPLAQGNNYRIYDEMRDDDQVKAAICIKKDILLSTGWDIACEDQEIADTIKANLQEKTESAFEESLRDMLSSFEYGFSLAEVIYRKPKETGLYEVKDIKVRPPHTFQFDLNDLGNVISIRQRQEGGEKAFPPNYFLHHIYEPDWGNPYGRSDLRSAFQPWTTKKFFLRMWAIHVERFSSPTVLGRAPKDAGPEERQSIFNMLKTLQNSTVWAVPEGTDIEFIQDKRDGSAAYSQAINTLNTMIARAVLVPDLLGFSGEQTSSGSLALGKTQFQLFNNLIKKEQQALARRITLKIIRPMVLANWGDMPCKFVFNPFNESDVTDNLKLWTEAVKGKIWTASDEEINHFRETISFPTTDEVERPKTVFPPGPFNPGEMGAPEDKNVPRGTIDKKGDKSKEDDKKDDDKDNEAAREAGKKLAQDEGLLRRRSKSEEKIDFAEITKLLDRSERSVGKSLNVAAKNISDDLLKQIEEKNIFGSRFKPDAFNEIKPRFQKPMKVIFKRHFQELFRESFNMAQKEFFSFAESKFKEIGELLPEEFLDVIDSESFKVVGDYSTLITNKARNVITQGIKNGKAQKEILSEIRVIFSDETDRWLNTVISTKTTEMFNRGRKSFYDNDEIAKQIVEGFEFSAIIDNRTSEVCSFLDGKIFEKGELTDSIVPPLHFNCRSLLVPVTKFEDFRSEKGFRLPSQEPSLDTLKDKGGNLILVSQHEIKEFRQAKLISINLRMPGNWPIIEAPGPGKSIQLISYHIANMSTRDFGVIGLMEEDAEEIRFQRLLNATEVMKDQFIKRDLRWVLTENKGLFLHNPSGLDLEINVKYDFVLPE